MPTEIADLIESLSVEDYINAYQDIRPTETQIKMLQLHYSVPEQAGTAKELAYGMGWDYWGTWNLHYGKFAGQFREVLQIPPEGYDNVYVFCTFAPSLTGEVLLILRPQVVEAVQVLGIVQGAEFFFDEEFSIESPLTEGASRLIQVNAFERNPFARKRCIAEHGTTCVICGFNFEKVYGSAAKDFIHVHHLKPLASIGAEYEIDPEKDMRPVCPNCHAVIHLRKKPYSIQQVKKMIAAKRSC